MKFHIRSLDRAALITLIFWEIFNSVGVNWCIGCRLLSCFEGVGCSFLESWDETIASTLGCDYFLIGFFMGMDETCCFCIHLLFLPSIPNHATCRFLSLLNSKLSLETVQLTILIGDSIWLTSSINNLTIACEMSRWTITLENDKSKALDENYSRLFVMMSKLKKNCLVGLSHWYIFLWGKTTNRPSHLLKKMYS